MRAPRCRWLPAVGEKRGEWLGAEAQRDPSPFCKAQPSLGLITLPRFLSDPAPSAPAQAGEGTALFGGTFDPPHLGHTAIAEGAVEELGLRRIVFLPCRQSPHKGEGATPADLRAELVEIATRDLPGAEVSRFEVERPPPSLSWQTAEHFSKISGEEPLFWLLGSDQWEVIGSWSRADYLAALVTFIVYPRPGCPARPQDGFRAVFLGGAPHDLSSTRVRQLVASGGSTEGLLDPRVRRRVDEAGLYRGSDPKPSFV